MTSPTTDKRLPLQASAIFFDYGGTLDTDARHWSHVLFEKYRQAAIPVSEAHFREAYVHGERTLGAAAVIEPTDTFLDVLRKKVVLEMDYLAAQGYWNAPEAERRRAAADVAERCNDYVLTNLRQTRRVLEELQRHTLCLVSNFYGNLPAVLRDYGLDHYFTVVVESAAVGIRKPDAAIYRLALERAGVDAADALVVGDSYTKDIVPAKALGCQAVWLEGEEWAPAERDKSLPDAVIHHLPELLDVVAR